MDKISLFFKGLISSLLNLLKRKIVKQLSSLLIVTLLPILLVVTFEPVCKGGIFWVIIWIISFIFVALAYIQHQSVAEGPVSTETLRHIVLSQRKYFTIRAQKISDWVADGVNVADIKEFLNKVNYVLNLDDSRHQILREVFYTFSDRNKDLNKHFRVTLMEPLNDQELAIVDFANSEDERPKSVSLGRKFRKLQSCAGWAWYLKDMFIIRDIDYHRQNRELKHTFWEDIPPVDAQEFAHKNQMEAKSVVSVPIIINSKNSLSVKAIMNIDCDIPYFFGDSETGRQSIRVKAYPYIRHLAFLYVVKDLINTIANTSKRSA